MLTNMFCPTGVGGGVDPHCGSHAGFDLTASNKEVELVKKLGFVLSEVRLTDKQFQDAKDTYGFYKKQDSTDMRRVEAVEERWGSLPPIVVGGDKKDWWTTDGVHRVAIAAHRGIRTLPAYLPKSEPTINTRVKNILRADPTRTATLRRSFETEMVRRFVKFRRELVSLIVDEDAFGLKEANKPWSPVINSQFSSTQINVTDPECLRRIRELQGRLDPADVVELETEPHVTVRYGLHGQDPEAVRELVANVFCKTGEGGGVDPSCRLTTAEEFHRTMISMSAEEAKSFKLYRGGSFSAINKTLRTGKKPSEAIENHIKNMDRIVQRTEIPSGTEVYRFDSWTGWKDLVSGDARTIDLPSYTSTTTKSSSGVLSAIDRSHKITMVIDDGVHGIPLSGGRHAGEKEILLERGLRAELVSVGKSNELGFSEIKVLVFRPPTTNSFGPIWMTIGRLSLFQQPEHDVLKLDVESKGLERLNAELGRLPNVQTHDNYQPHLTVAYLKPGTGYKYLADPSFLEWQSYVFTELTFSDRERRQTELALNVFCSTGEGGGVDPSCSPGRGSTGNKRIGQTLHDVSERFPLSRPSKVELEDADEVAPPGVGGGERFGYHDRQTGKIVLAASKDALYQESVAAPEGETVDASVEGALRHEMGHQLYSKIGAVERADWEGTHALIADDHYLSGVASRRGGASDVSEEYFAEAFSLYSSHDYEHGQLPKIVVDFFQRYEKQDVALNVFCKTGQGGGVDPSCSPKISIDKYASGLKEKDRLDMGVVKGISPAKSCNKFGDCTDQTFKEYKKSGATVYEGYAVLKTDLVQAEETYKKMIAEYGEDEVGPHASGLTAIPHAWNVKDGKILDRTLGSEGAEERAYFGKQIPEERLRKMTHGDDLRDQGLEWVENTSWSFRSSPEKIKEFLRWLEGNLRPILTDEATTEDDWWNKYVMAGFKKGAARSYDDMKRAGAIPQSNLPFYLGQKDEFLKSAFRQPESVEKVKLLAGRVYTELRGVTEAMSQNLTRTLTDGLMQGMNPRQIATNIVRDVENIGIKRARVIARTEIIRAHAEGQLDSMERLGVERLAVMVEWNTAQDDRVCKLCAPLDGIVVTIDEAKGLIPRHPQCRCAFVPANVGEDPAEQIRGAARIKRAITKSLVARKSKRKSTWAGARHKISKSRPKSRV